LKQEELLTAKNILNFDNNFDYIGINTGATWNTKKWILENYVELVKRLLADGKKVVLIGGKTDLEFNKKIKEEIDTNINFIDLTAKLSERELFSVISLLKMIFTTDSASLHIAQAFNVPVFAIFGPTVKEFGFWYKGAKDFLFEDTNLKCRPCALHGNNKCPKRHFNCMKNISVDIVYFKIKNFFMNIYI
jgi:heptosyltransferase II